MGHPNLDSELKLVFCGVHLDSELKLVVCGVLWTLNWNCFLWLCFGLWTETSFLRYTMDSQLEPVFCGVGHGFLVVMGTPNLCLKMLGCGCFSKSKCNFTAVFLGAPPYHLILWNLSFLGNLGFKIRVICQSSLQNQCTLM